MKSVHLRRGLGSLLYDIAIVITLIILGVFTLYPFYNSLIMSFNEGKDLLQGSIYLLPRKFTFENYLMILKSKMILTAAMNSVLRTIIGTFVALVFTSIFSYAVSKKDLVFRKFYLVMGLITMYFNGGFIPNLLLMRDLGLTNNFLVYILPMAFNMFNAVLFLSFFKTIPASIEESAKIDGANDFTIFFRIIIPVSKPIYAAVALFTGVAQWNSWFDNYMYTSRNDSLITLSFFFQKIISQQQVVEFLPPEVGGLINLSGITTTSVVLAAMVVSCLPIICIYPLLQKYFIKGIMIGSVKG